MQTRSKNGQYSKSRFKIYLSIIILLLLVVYLGANWNYWFKKTEYIKVPVEKLIVNDTAKQIIEKEKNDILDTLELCESGGDINAINWEDYGFGKNRASFGPYMLKVGTIQLFRKDLTDYQAIQLAMNKDQARALSAEIIFENEGGIYNWKNCMKKYGLFERVEFIKKLELKTK